MMPFSDVGGSTMDHEIPTGPQEKVWAPGHGELHPPPRPAGGAGPPTFGMVPVDSFPDQGLSLPERCPQQVVGATADLNHLPGGVHQGPR